MNNIFKFVGNTYFWAYRLLAMAPFLVFSHGAGAQEILLGQTTAPNNPLVSALSRDYNAGIQMALARANAVGGVQGRKIKLIARDDGFDAKQTIALVDELVERQNVLALVGFVGTQMSL